MALINLNNKQIILEKEVLNEDQIHEFINQHLYEIFGLKLIQKKMKLGDIEVDSLCIDLNNFLCIIEFKKEQDSEQIAQILDYFDNISSNIREIKNRLNINFNKDWIQLICIAKDYDERIINLINKLDFEGYDILLYKYGLYEGNLLFLERVETDKGDYYFNEFWQSLSEEQKNIINIFIKKFNFYDKGLDEETYEDCIIYKKGKRNIVEIWRGKSDNELEVLFSQQNRITDLIQKFNLEIKAKKKKWVEISVKSGSIKNLIDFINEVIENGY